MRATREFHGGGIGGRGGWWPPARRPVRMCLPKGSGDDGGAQGQDEYGRQGHEFVADAV